MPSVTAVPGRFVAPFKEHEGGKRGVDRDLFCRCWRSLDISRRQRNRDLNAAIDMLRLLKVELAGQMRPSYFTLELRASKRRRW